jgi:hypothetical protein
VKQFLDGSRSPSVTEKEAETHCDFQRPGKRLSRAIADEAALVFGARLGELWLAIVEDEQKFFAAVTFDKIVGADGKEKTAHDFLQDLIADEMCTVLRKTIKISS